MPIRVTTTAHGAPALDALAGAVRAAKAGDPLAPVTVIVPTNTVGVMARRALGRRGGAAAIDVLTLFRVAELLGAPSLVVAGRAPVSTPVVDLAVEQVLARSPGLYHRVRGHPSTIVALRDLYRELRVVGPSAMTALARTARGSEPARVAADVARRLARSWYDEGDLLVRAAERARRDPPQRLARVVVHLPERLRRLERELLAAIAERCSVELIVGLTGDADADAAVVGLVHDLTGDEPPPSPQPAPAHVVEVVSTTDADDEVRLAVRFVLDEARRGTPFDRMAVLWPTQRPYARMVERQLSAAAVPWNGRPGTQTAERKAPRLLAEVLELDRRGLRRTTLMALLTDVPARDAGGRPLPTARWERIGRRAGIVREADWDPRLAAALADASRTDERDAAEALGGFVAELRGALGAPADRHPWSHWVRWSHERLDRWFGPGQLDRLDGAEHEAWEQTQRVLDRLAHLDTIGGPVTRAEFRATFVAELEVTPTRHGKVGDGVHVGALAGAGGLDVDVVAVLGAADGLLPPPPVIDPLLGDGERAAAGLVSSDERAATAHRGFLAVVGSTSRALVTVPRGDLRVTTTNHPSRWLDGLVARGLVGATTVLDSHAQALAVTEFPATAAEHRLRELWTHVAAGGDLRTHRLASHDHALGRALRLRDARRLDVLSEYDGDLTSRSMPPREGPISPSRVELWPRCPHAYFVRYVLGVRPVDEPEDLETITPLDRGAALHTAIDRLQRAVLAGELPAPGPRGWGAVHRQALRAIGSAVADELEVSGRTGRPAAWANERERLLRELDRWIAVDAERWAGRRICSSELRFGEDAPVALTLPDGRRVEFFGQIDRIDQLPSGTLVVTDHKTGKADVLAKLSALDPTLGATRFQLPVYAAAASALVGPPDAEVHAEYAFFDREGFRRVGITFDEACWKQVLDDLALVLDGIDAGLFPSRPEPPAWRPWVACEYCEPDGLGTAVRWAEWEAKRHDPRLARWFGEQTEAGS